MLGMGPPETTVQHHQAHSYGPSPSPPASAVFSIFGYDTGVISSTLVSIGGDLGHPLTTLDKSLITSCASLSALIASPLAALLADRIGRKPIVLIADVLFITGALCQSVITSVSVWHGGGETHRWLCHGPLVEQASWSRCISPSSRLQLSGGNWSL